MDGTQGCIQQYEDSGVKFLTNRDLWLSLRFSGRIGLKFRYLWPLVFMDIELFFNLKDDFFFFPAATIFSCMNCYDETLQSCHYVGDISINHTLLDTVIE